LGNDASTCSGVQQSSSPVAPAICLFALLVLTLSRPKRLVGCAAGPVCPNPLAERAVRILREAYAQDENPCIDSARQVEPLPEDLEMGAEEVWCVNLTFTCWSCDYGEFRTCADSRLMRRIGDNWKVTLVLTDVDREKWEARGCELIEDTVAR